ncbi:hypothetical protein JHK86_057246 (mitochondrion) [Glycine max]|nr:hypothetical protein JHK86_057246 [Glycine max]
MQSSSETFYTLVWRLACSLSKEALSRLLLRGSSVTLIMAGGFALRAFFLATEGGLSMENSMMPHPHGAAESTHSDGFTYTSDMVPDSSSSGRSISSVEQPIPEEKPYIALLQLEGERKRVMEEILHIVEGQLEDPGLPRGPHEQALRFCWRLAFYLGNQALSRLLLQRGCSVGLTVAIAVLFGDTPSVGNNMMDPSGSSGSSGGGGSESSWTGALLSSETLSGTGSVNQPAEGMPVPPANPVVEQAGPANPEDTTEIIGGDSIDSIRNRLLQSYGNPSAEQISRASYDADDLFQVKVEIIRGMTPLDPEGDWPGRGARALDNPRTSTGEDSLENLYRLKDDLNENGRDSETFKRLKDKVFRRPRPLEDANSTT